VSATLALERRATAQTPWAACCALLSVLCAVPLVLFGGSVTTLGAGMAVDGWLIAEGHFLLFFPVDKWFRDTPTFVEHTHRLFGSLVGFFALATLAFTWVRRESKTARWSALVALLAVILQGALGGLRVLENDPGLAFLHGALGQLVFAVLCVNAVVLSGTWQGEVRPAASALDRRALERSALMALLVTYAQVFLGAWYRHGLRPTPVESSTLRLALHGAGALVVLLVLAGLVRRSAALTVASGALPGSFEFARRALPILLLLQLLLGGMAWAGFRPGAVGPAEWALSIAHVLGGALLFATTAVLYLWTRRFARAGAG
jgi:cytochrome c oxidase assembly protein subunit 15